MSHTITFSELSNPDVICRSCAASSDPIFISAGGQERMVLLNIDVYRNLYAKLQVYQALEAGEDDIAAGRESDAFVMLDRLEAKRRV